MRTSKHQRRQGMQLGPDRKFNRPWPPPRWFASARLQNLSEYVLSRVASENQRMQHTLLRRVKLEGLLVVIGPGL